MKEKNMIEKIKTYFGNTEDLDTKLKQTSLRNESKGMSKDEILEKIKIIRPLAQINYLEEVAEKKGIMANSTYKNILSVIWDIAKENDIFNEASITYSRIGEKKLSGNADFRAGDIHGAMVCYRDIGIDHKKVAKWGGKQLMKQREYSDAGQVFESAEEFKLAGDAYVLSENNYAAIKAYEKAGEYKLAGDLTLPRGPEKDALKLYKKAGLQSEELKKLIEEDLVSSDDYHQIARELEDEGKFKESADAYVKVKEYDEAGILYSRVGEFELAGDVFKKVNFRRAAGAYENAGLYLKAANVLWKGDGPDHGLYTWAAQNYVKGGLDKKRVWMRTAKRILEFGFDSGYQSVGYAYEQAGEFKLAGDNYNLGGHGREAMKCYKLAKA